MAELFVINSLSTQKVVKFNIGLRQLINTNTDDGKLIWVLDIGTTTSGIDGREYLSTKVHRIDGAGNLDEAIERALGDMCQYVDWRPLVDDKESPYLDSYEPSGNNVPIFSNVEIGITEDIPTSGIDLSNMKVTLNNGVQDFDITSEVEITGDPYLYKLKWEPTIRRFTTY